MQALLVALWLFLSICFIGLIAEPAQKTFTLTPLQHLLAKIIGTLVFLSFPIGKLIQHGRAIYKEKLFQRAERKRGAERTERERARRGEIDKYISESATEAREQTERDEYDKQLTHERELKTHVHRVSDAIQPSHPLSSPSPPAPNPSQHQSLCQ